MSQADAEDADRVSFHIETVEQTPLWATVQCNSSLIVDLLPFCGSDEGLTGAPVAEVPS